MLFALFNCHLIKQALTGSDVAAAEVLSRVAGAQLVYLRLLPKKEILLLLAATVVVAIPG